MNINPMIAFLESYDICCKNYSEQECRSRVASTAETVVDKYLITYNICKTALGPAKCKEVYGGEPVSINVVAAIASALLGFVLCFFWKDKKKKALPSEI